MHKGNVHEIPPGKCLFSVSNVSWFSGIPEYDVSSEADNPVRMHPLPVLHLPGFQKKHPSELSGGQRRRVALARLLVYQPKILLFDEPTTGLDPITGQQIATLIRTTQKHLGATAILVTHDGATAANIGDYFALHEEGVISSFGDRNWFLSCKDPLVQSFLGHTSEESAKP